MSGYNGLENELLDTSFDKSDLKTYYMIKNVEVKEYNIIQFKGSPHKGDILGILPDESIYIYWNHHKHRTIEQMKYIV